ncbi:SDR family NAD(P)-dependent oxidoreductase [Nocardia sp. NPDC003482]
MVSYLVTGGTAALDRRVIRRLLDRDPDAIVHVLVRERDAADLAERTASWGAADRVFPLLGDPTAEDLGLHDDPPPADHILRLGPVDVAGVRAVIALATRLGAMLHHVSSVAVAGDHRGRFFEDDFDLGQHLATPSQRAHFAAEKLVRESPGLRWRVYRTAIVVGDSRTGETDRIDGPYHFFPAVARLAELPSELPLPLPDLGATNIVPVDYVAAALVELVRRPGLNHRTFHLVNPRPQPFAEIYAALARAAGAPAGIGAIPGSHAALGALGRVPIVRQMRDTLLRQWGIPPEAADVTFDSEFIDDSTRAQLRGSGLTVPEFGDYAVPLWRYWSAHLDPDRDRRGADRLRGRVVLVANASSDTGLAIAHAVARRGATVLMVAPGTDELESTTAALRAEGAAAQAYQCDLTDEKAVQLLAKHVLADHDHVDYIVAESGRAVSESSDDTADSDATRLILALLPSMRDRRFGHIVTLSPLPRSDSAPNPVTEIAAENAPAGITLTPVHLPPTHTPTQSADLVLHALTDRPTPLTQFLDTLLPSMKTAILHHGTRLLSIPTARFANRIPAVHR